MLEGALPKVGGKACEILIRKVSISELLIYQGQSCRAAASNTRRIVKWSTFCSGPLHQLQAFQQRLLSVFPARYCTES